MQKKILMLLGAVVLLTLTIFFALKTRESDTQDIESVATQPKATQIQSEQNNGATVEQTNNELNKANQTDEPILSSGEIQKTVQSQKTNDKLVTESLSEIKQILSSMNTRIDNLENQVTGLSNNQLPVANSQSALSGGAIVGGSVLDNENDSTLTIDADTPSVQLQKQQAQQLYYSQLDQLTTADVDPNITLEVEQRYSELLNGREDWIDAEVKLKSTGCGSAFCKIEVSYNSEIDPGALFDLEAELIVGNMDYPHSAIRQTVNQDGSHEFTLYFAKNAEELPLINQ